MSRDRSSRRAIFILDAMVAALLMEVLAQELPGSRID